VGIPVVPDQITPSIYLEFITMSSSRSQSEDLEDRRSDPYFDARENEENEDDDPDYDEDEGDDDEDEGDDDGMTHDLFDEADEFHG
jgi:hypothetical protein